MKNMWLSSIGRAKKVILCIWIVSGVLAIPTAIRIDYVYSQQEGTNERQYWCHRRFPHDFLGWSKFTLNKAYAVYQLLILIVFPVVTMTICYARVSLIVYSSSKDHRLLSHAMAAFSKAATDAVTFTSYSSIPIASCRLKTATTTMNSLTNKKSCRVAESNKKQIVQMLISIVVMYLICWLPWIVDDLLVSYDYICRNSNTSALKHMRMGFNALTYCQSCLNPVCYAFISQNFRATFKIVCARMKAKLQGVEDTRSRVGSCSSASMLSTTRNRHRVCGSQNTLTVPGRSIITPNMSRDVSQLSLCRPRTPNTMVTCDGQSTMMRPRSPTTESGRLRPRSPTADSGRPRSPTDLSHISNSFKRNIRCRSPTEDSTMATDRPRSPTVLSSQSSQSAKERHTLLFVVDATRPRTPDFV